LNTTHMTNELKELLTNELKPYVKAIDREGMYPEAFLKQLGQRGFYRNASSTITLQLIEQISSVCGSTAFSVWCHTNAIHFIRSSQNDHLKQHVLPSLENCEILGGTGLSNPMKYYAGLEPLRLKAKRISGGYSVNGILSYVSNLGPDHWFGIVAEVSDQQRIMAMVPCYASGLTLEKREEFLGLNGTATFTCKFSNVMIPDKWVIAEQADTFVKSIRTFLVGNQIGLALGIIHESVQAMRDQYHKQHEVNRYLRTHPEELEMKWNVLRKNTYTILEKSSETWNELLRMRLNSAYLAIEAAQGELFHTGSSGYLLNSSVSRRLREAYFITQLTPTVKHLEKLIHASSNKNPI
jgi:alkylation response protein AidB-like acyl-CoA dehydrogenase